MTTEIVQFKCPSCGHLLGEQEFKHACEVSDSLVNERLEQIERELKIKHERQLQQQQENNDNDKEREVCERLIKIRKEEMAKHNQALLDKDRQIEATKLQSTINREEEIRQAITEKEREREQEKTMYKLHIQRLEKDNTELTDKTKQLTGQIEEQRKTIENIPPELRGTGGEIDLFNDLHNAFPKDELVPKKVGVEMADVIQTIVIENGEKIAPPIVWDRKTGDKVTSLDINKARKYKTTHNTDFSIIVTEKGITKKDSNNTLIGTREGIYLVHPTIVVEIGRLFRTFIIEMAKRTNSNKGKTSKQATLYDYLSGSEYARTLKMIRDAKSNLDDLQRKEEDYHKTTWNTRKKSIDEWFKIGEWNQQIINGIIQDQTCERIEDEPNNREQ
jgi:hypothetical protein